MLGMPRMAAPPPCEPPPNQTFNPSVQFPASKTLPMPWEALFPQPLARRARITVCHDLFVSDGILARLFEGVTVIRSEPSMTRHGETEYLLEGPMFDELAPGQEIPIYTAVMHADARPIEWRRR